MQPLPTQEGAALPLSTWAAQRDFLPRKENWTVEKPDKHLVSQVIKVTIRVVSHVDSMSPDKGPSSPQPVASDDHREKNEQTNPSGGMFYTTAGQCFSNRQGQRKQGRCETLSWPKGAWRLVTNCRGEPDRRPWNGEGTLSET